MSTFTYKTKPILCGALIGFFVMLILAELFGVFLHSSPYGEWTQRRLKETTALEMHAEDIWKNDRSTLKTFDPLACQSSFHHEWRATWQEVACPAEDETGQEWTYVVRYGMRSSYFISWLPFIKDTRPAKKLLRTNGKSIDSGRAQ